MNVDDTRLDNTQYRLAFNCRNRFDVLEPIHSSYEDSACPPGLKQGILTFGTYVIVFVAGYAYYRYYLATGWKMIDGFRMSSDAPRVWFEQIPVATTNYKRYLSSATQINGDTFLDNVAGAAAGNLPGLLVQDNINQPQFIFIDSSGFPTCRTTQNYDEWSVDWASYTAEKDKREYVPIGNAMSWCDGVLYVASQDKNEIYRSVTGRPLDFVVNIDNTGQKGGDATTTSYSVGVGGISALRQMSDGSLFVAAGNANFIVSKNMTPNATIMFNEYTFIRKFLFNSTCLDDRCILDSLGDTRFIDLGGIRSFNAIEQLNNVGRNSVFSVTINAAFGGIRQTSGVAAAILYDNYELYSVKTIFGNVIAVYDTINQIWVAFDTQQTGGKAIKQFAKIELDVQRLYAITEDDRLVTLYIADTFDEASLRPPAINANSVDAQDEKAGNNLLRHYIKPTDFRCVLNEIRQDSTATLTTFVDNRLSVPAMTKAISYSPPATTYDSAMPDINTKLEGCYWSLPNSATGWKCFFLLSWTGGGNLTQISATMRDSSPRNPLPSQS